MRTVTFLVVLVAGLAMLAIAGCKDHADQTTPATVDGSVAISVTENGFVPNEIHLRAGQPVTLVVTRRTEKTCATELVLKDYDISRKLPLNESVRIPFTPTQSGSLTYSCAMGMIQGHIVVE